MKEEFFSKFIDYNRKLEKILETKDFSIDVKNLLLSMLYRIDISYSDYQHVKRGVKNKQDFLEDVLRIIENCEQIELIKPTSEDGILFQKKGIKYEVDFLTYQIKTLENEVAILEALFQLDNTSFYLPEKYNLIRVALPEILNEGRVINNIEIIRDFNAWSWNVLKDEINSFAANIIYKNLEMLIGQEQLEEWIITDEIENKIEWLIDILEQEHEQKEIDKYLKLIYKIAIDICINKNELEKQRLQDEKRSLEEEYNQLNNKETYLEKVTKEKKQGHREIEKIDKIINDKTLLEQEYQRRNENLSKYNKILNLEHLVEILKKERKKIINRMEQANRLLNPNVYLQTLNHIKEQLDILEDLKNEKVKETKIQNEIIDLQKIFLVFLKQKMENVGKKELVDYMYMIRYYAKIPFSTELDIGQLVQLEELLQEIEEFTIEKMYEFKLVNKISEDKNFNIKVLRNIFHNNIIHLEDIYIQINQQNNQYILEIYDKDILEKKVYLMESRSEMKEFSIKQKKKIKVFS